MEEDKNIQTEDQVLKEDENKAQAKKKKQRKETELLKEQIDTLSDKLSKEKEDYVRLMAEFETFRRRSAEDKIKLKSIAAADTVKGLLPILDDCERAMQILSASSDEAAKEGTALIYHKLMDYLKTLGLERIEAKGETFDTDFHEALTQIPAPNEDMVGKVIDIVQTGYTFGGQVLRYAKVVVGA